ncbi:MAG: hypothetical protein CR991_07650 [Proteobacteria bacterium]|nr:MAG: hypothetical protein CR991_07650 [Pseudomonadota bacterium]
MNKKHYWQGLILSGLLASTAAIAQTASRTIEIQPNDTLSEIVARYYPVDNNARLLIMQHLLEKNPQAFAKGNINYLRVGRQLTLIDIKAIPGIRIIDEPTKTETETATTSSPAAHTTSTSQTRQNELSQQIERLTTEKASLQQQLEQLQKDTQQSQTKLETTSTQLRDENAKLKQALEQAKAQLTEAQTTPAAIPSGTKAEPVLDENGNPVDMAAMEVEMLKEQLDSLDAANLEIRDENTKLKQELEQAKTQLAEAQAAPATTTSGTEAEPVLDENGNPVDMAAMEVEMLKEQLDSLDAANVEIRAENEALKQQLANAQALTSPTDTKSSTEIDVLRNELTQAQQELQLARAALANAELTQHQQSRSLAWWIWGLLLLSLPLAWFLGRQSKSTSTPAHAATNTADDNNALLLGLRETEPNSAVTTTTTPTEQTVYPELTELTGLPSNTAVAITSNDDTAEAALKLDIARAYLDLRDPQSALPILQEVLVEGGQQQKQEAKEILSFIS